MLGPALIDVAQVAVVLAPESSRTVMSEPLLKLGSSFTAVTVTVKESSTVNPLEVPRTVIVALPF